MSLQRYPDRTIVLGRMRGRYFKKERNWRLRGVQFVLRGQTASVTSKQWTCDSVASSKISLVIPGRAAESTRVVNYSSNFLLLEYSLFLFPVENFIPDCNFCSHLTNCWNLCKVLASRFYLQQPAWSQCTTKR